MSTSSVFETGAPSSSAFVQRLDRLLGTAAALMLLVLMGITCIDVTGRYLFNRPLPGGIELTELGMGALIFTSLPLVTICRQHVRVDLVELLPSYWRTSQQALADMISAVCMAVVGWQMWIKAGDMSHTGETTATLQIAVYPLLYFMAVLTFATTALILVLAWADARGARNLSEAHS